MKIYLLSLKKQAARRQELYLAWRPRFLDLKEWLRTHKEYPNVKSDDPFEKSLACWVATQKVRYSHSNHGEYHPLQKRQILALQSLRNWKWRGEPDVRKQKENEKRNEVMLRRLKVYLSSHSFVYPQLTDASKLARELSRWINKIKQVFKEGRLPASLAIQLESLPNWSWGRYKDHPVPLKYIGVTHMAEPFVLDNQVTPDNEEEFLSEEARD